MPVVAENVLLGDGVQVYEGVDMPFVLIISPPDAARSAASGLPDKSGDTTHVMG